MIAAAPALTPFVVPATRPHLDGLVYDEVAREHTFRGRRILSVTQILSTGGLTDFSHVNPTVLQRKGLVGTAAHIAAHYCDEGDLATATVDPLVAPYLEAWQLFRRDRRFVPECLETVVCSRRHGFVGRLDRVGLVDGRRVVADLKTGDPDAARADVQTWMYVEALREEFPALFADSEPARWSVQLLKNGYYRVCEYPAKGRSWRHDDEDFRRALAKAREATGVTWSAPMPEIDPIQQDIDEAMPTLAGLDVDPEPDPDPEPEPEFEPEPVADSEPEPDPEPAAMASLDAPTAIADPQVVVGTRDQVVERAVALAKAVQDQATCQAAANFAVVLADWIKVGEAFFDPRVAQSHAVWKRDCDDRNAFLEPLRIAKETLTGKAGAVTRWLAEQKRLADEQRIAEQREKDRLAEEQRQAAEHERLENEAKKREELQRANDAVKAGDLQTAAAATEAARTAGLAAQDAAQRKEAVVSEVVPETKAPAVAGVQGKASWTFQLLDADGRVDNGSGDELKIAAATPHVLKRLIAYLQGIPGWETATGKELVAAIDFFEGQQPDIPLLVTEVNETYLRMRARADHGTLKWPGCRFYDAGAAAIAPRRRRP